MNNFFNQPKNPIYKHIKQQVIFTNLFSKE